MRLIALTLILAAPAASAQELGSAPRGETLAREVCAECHAVDRDEAGPDANAPGLPAVADLASTTRQSLLVFLTTPHPTMPDLILEPQEVDDITAYILSLRDN